VRVLSLVDRASIGKGPSQQLLDQTGLLDVDLIPHPTIMHMLDKIMKCPNCRRTILRRALVRADVLFGDWGRTPSENEKRIEFYV